MSRWIPPTPKEKALIEEIQVKIKDVKEILNLVKSGSASELLNGPAKNFKPLIGFHGDHSQRNKFYASALRQILIESVIEKKKLLDRKDVEKLFRRKIRNTLFINDLIRINGIVFQRVDGRVIAREDPERFFQRVDYLNKIKALRVKQNPIVYVGTFEFPCLEIFSTLEPKSLLVISPKYGHIESPRGAFDQGWLVDIINRVPEKITFVIDEEIVEDKEGIPSINSTRKQMESWLILHCVPFDNEMHRSELYRLVELKKKTVLNKNEMMAKTFGCDVIIMKNKSWVPNYFDRLAKEIVDPKWTATIKIATAAITNDRNLRGTYSFMNTLPQKLWKDVEEQLMFEEQKILEEDLHMDYCLDTLLKGTKHEKVQYNDYFVYN